MTDLVNIQKIQKVCRDCQLSYDDLDKFEKAPAKMGRCEVCDDVDVVLVVDDQAVS